MNFKKMNPEELQETINELVRNKDFRNKEFPKLKDVQLGEQLVKFYVAEENPRSYATGVYIYHMINKGKKRDILEYANHYLTFEDSNVEELCKVLSLAVKTYIEIDAIEEAFPLQQRLVELDYAYAHLNMATLLYRRHQLDEAITYLENRVDEVQNKEYFGAVAQEQLVNSVKSNLERYKKLKEQNKEYVKKAKKK